MAARSSPALASPHAPSAQALTFGLLQKGGDAVGVHLGLPELHQWKEEGLQGGVEGLQQGETQAEAFDGDVCDRAQSWS